MQENDLWQHMTYVITVLPDYFLRYVPFNMEASVERHAPFIFKFHAGGLVLLEKKTLCSSEISPEVILTYIKYNL